MHKSEEIIDADSINWRETMSLADLIVEFKESVRQRTRNLYPKIPADRIAFAPVEGALTLGQILHHLPRFCFL